MRLAGQIIGFFGMVILVIGFGGTFRAWHPDAEPETRRARRIVGLSAIVGVILLATSAALLNGQS